MTQAPRKTAKELKLIPENIDFSPRRYQNWTTLMDQTQ